jgi:hypothetical protein
VSLSCQPCGSHADRLRPVPSSMTQSRCVLPDKDETAPCRGKKRLLASVKVAGANNLRLVFAASMAMIKPSTLRARVRSEQHSLPRGIPARMHIAIRCWYFKQHGCTRDCNACATGSGRAPQAYHVGSWVLVPKSP